LEKYPFGQLAGRLPDDLLEPLVERVVVTHPPHIKLIAAAMVKTDKKDTMTLAKLLAVKLAPEVWVPPVHVRDLRALLAHRRRLISQQTQSKNRLQSVLHRNHIVPPQGKLYHLSIYGLECTSD